MNSQGHIRIIGGQWRGRQFSVVDMDGLRPTPNRIRETLFNWLQMSISGSSCLDLFSGSGALGFEALSRRAAEVFMVEKQRKSFQQLEATKSMLNAQQAHLVYADAITWLAQQEQRFDIIFLDPPFYKGLIQHSLELIKRQGVIAEEGSIYIECEAEIELPENLIIEKQKQAGQVQYGLYQLC